MNFLKIGYWSLYSFLKWLFFCCYLIMFCVPCMDPLIRLMLYRCFPWWIIIIIISNKGVLGIYHYSPFIDKGWAVSKKRGNADSLGGSGRTTEILHGKWNCYENETKTQALHTTKHRNSQIQVVYYTINVPLEVNNRIISLRRFEIFPKVAGNISNLRGEIIRLFTDNGTYIVLSHSSLHRSKGFISVFRQSIIEGERDVKELKCETYF